MKLTFKFCKNFRARQFTILELFGEFKKHMTRLVLKRYFYENNFNDRILFYSVMLV